MVLRRLIDDEELSNSIVYIEEPYLISDVLCTICYVDSLDNSEKLCFKLNNRAMDEQYLLKVSLIG